MVRTFFVVCNAFWVVPMVVLGTRALVVEVLRVSGVFWIVASDLLSDC